MEEKRKLSPRNKQKLKIMYLMKILMEETDETHSLTLQEIVKKLEAYDVTAERKSLYSDIEHLKDFGIEVDGYQKDRTYHYRIIDREFQLPELKLLVDAVQASKFITEKESERLIAKLETYASKHQAKQMHRQVYVNGRIKSKNEKNYYSVDDIYTAIDADRKLSFQYFYYGVDKKVIPSHDGKEYHVSPWAMCWDDEKYYLIGYDEDPKEPKIKHFRVDKMMGTKILEEKRIGEEEFRKLDMSRYTDRLFGMFDGELQKVELVCENRMANVIFDRFGTEIPVLKVDDEHFQVAVSVAVSKLFLGWIMSLDGVRIIGPDPVVEMVKDQIRQQQKLYGM